jgi:diaminopimelate decarboxylase
MSYFKYIQNKYSVENTSVLNIIKKNRTPFYLYSGKQLNDNYKNFTKNFKDINPLICYSVKSNSNISILKSLAKLGSGADVVSAGELLKALKAGIKSKKIVFSGVGKTEDELKLAIKKKILLINIESESEAKLINKLSKKLGKKTSIGIRLNPDIEAKTHKKISTGKAEDKFGLTKKNLITFCKNIKDLEYLKLDALSVHIGSQILSDNPYRKTLNVLTEIIKKIGIKPKFIDLGGGFGIPYQKKDKKIKLKNYSKLVKKFARKLNCKIIFEPGRSIVGNTSILVSKIQYIKRGIKKSFIILDAGMNDFMRPALYDATHDIIPIIKTSKKNNAVIEFVGPICETTCKFVKYSSYQKLSENDFVAITNTGAYGSSLSSNYNTKPLIAEILVNKNKYKIIRKKQDLLKLIKT